MLEFMAEGILNLTHINRSLGVTGECAGSTQTQVLLLLAEALPTRAPTCKPPPLVSDVLLSAHTSIAGSHPFQI